MAMVLLTFEQGELLAQYPKKLSYQGLLLINKDTPYPDSSYEITLTLYDAAQSGSVLWKETQTLTTVNGVFDAILGEITPLNLPFDKQYWLGITINPDPEFSPRVQLVANPYSFRSDTSNFAIISDTSKMSKGLTYNATGAVLSLNGKEGRLFISGGKGVTISSLGDTLLLDMQASIGPAYSSDLTLDIRRISDSTDLRIANNAVDTKHLKSNAVTTTKLADTSVTAAKINRMGAMTGQVLKWNGTTWVASNDSSKIYFAGRGIRIANDSIINVGDTDSTDDVSIDLVTTKGDVLGKFDSPYIRNGSVTSNKLNQMGASTGQILKWNGTTWAPALDSGKVYKAGLGIAISNDSIINTGDRDSSNDVTITRTSANGEVLGRFDSLYIKDGAVRTAKLADTSVTGAKINRMGATTGQILKWNGTTWVAANDTTGKYFAGAGIAISNDTIINLGDRDSTNDVTITRTSANGEVLGRFDSLYIKDGVVTTVKLANGAVTAAKLNQMGATTGQILKWNGTTWAPALDSGKVYKAGLGIAISNDSIINTGDQDSTDDVLKSTQFNGDVSGIYSNLTIKNGAVTAVKLNQMGATTGQILKWDGTTWAPSNSGIDYFEIARTSTIPNTVIPAHSITPFGNEGSIDFILSPKGSGSILTSIPSNSTNEKRGLKVIDLQLNRTQANQVAKGDYSVISGGQSNRIGVSGNSSVISGGSNNTITNMFSAISGGYYNYTSGAYSFIGGGSNDTTYDEYSVVVGGQGNTAGSKYNFIGSGYYNTITGDYSSIIGGLQNAVTNEYAVIGSGRQNKVTGNYGVVVGGWKNHNYGFGSILGGGVNNFINLSYSFIGGGYKDTVYANYAAISGGFGNIVKAQGYGGFIGGGLSNMVSDSTATVAGGVNNQALGRRSTVAGGISNTANNWYSTVTGGALNSALGEGSSVIGGVEMVLETSASNSFGFNGNIIDNTTSLYARRINISQPRTGVFNNVHLWLTNNDDTVRTLRFYEKYNTVGAFPNGTNYVAFKAPNSIATDVTYTLPAAAPTATGQVLSSTTAGVLSWVNAGGNVNDYFEFNDLNPGNQSSIQAHLIRPLGSEDDIDFVANPKGKGSFMLDYPDNSATGGAKRGIHSVDLQLIRNTQHQVVRADTSVISGGFANEIGNTAHTSVIIGGALNTASAYQSTVLAGRSNTASGQYSLVGGLGNTAGSYGETVFGVYATEAGGSASSFVSTDRLFAIGNGTSSTRSTAFSILKNGNTNISGTLDINNHVTIGGGSTASEIRIREASGTGSNYVGFKTGNATTDMIYTLPTAAPTTDGQFMVSSTNGTMTWNTPIVKVQNINVNPGNLVEYGGSESISITVTGAQVGGTVQVSPRAELETGIIIGYARVTAADTVSVRFVNTTNGPIDPAAVNVDVTVIQP
ncbi:MAG: hypothetical protein RLZZ578_928 [Bacteroidota bacterium]